MSGTITLGGKTLASHSNDTDALSLSSDVTSIYPNSFPLIKVGFSNNYTLTHNSSSSIVQFDNKIYDTNSRYNATGTTSNGIPAWCFKPDLSGYYYFFANISGSWQSENIAVETRISFNDGTSNTTLHNIVHQPVSPLSWGSGGVSAQAMHYFDGIDDYAWMQLALYNYTNFTNETVDKNVSFLHGYLVRR